MDATNVFHLRNYAAKAGIDQLIRTLRRERRVVVVREDAVERQRTYN